MKIFSSTSQFIFSSQIVYSVTDEILSENLLEDTKRNIISYNRRWMEQYELMTSQSALWPKLNSV